MENQREKYRENEMDIDFMQGSSICSGPSKSLTATEFLDQILSEVSLSWVSWVMDWRRTRRWLGWEESHFACSQHYGPECCRKNAAAAIT